MSAIQQTIPVVPVVPAPAKTEPGKHLEVKANQFKSESLAVKKIENNDQYVEVCNQFKAGSAVIKEVQAFFGPIKADAYTAWKNNCARENTVIAPLEEGKKHLGNLIRAYDDEQERIRQEEEARQRQQIQQQSQEQVIEEAIALESEGNIEAALETLDAGPGFVPAVTVPKAVPKVQGIVKSSTFKARIKGSSRNDPPSVDEMTQAEQQQFLELVKAVASGKVPLKALAIDWKFINQQSRSMKKLLSYPGIEVYEDKGLSARR